MAYDQTLQNLADSVAKKLSMEYGASVQSYAEDRILAYLQDIFDIIFYKRFWTQYTSWNTDTLDESTGKVTGVLTSVIVHWVDLEIVVRDGETRALPTVTKYDNPYSITGTSPKFIEATNDAKIFRVWPLAATGDVQFRVRLKPDDYAVGDTVDFDSMAMIYGAAYLYAEDDGTNHGAVDKFKGIFELRMKQLEFEDDQHTISLKRADASIPTDWE